MKRIQGDLLALAKAGEFDMIVHGCNCFVTMGSGIARQIADQFPQALAADKTTTISSYDKLGTYTMSSAEYNNGVINTSKLFTIDFRSTRVKLQSE